MRDRQGPGPGPRQRAAPRRRVAAVPVLLLAAGALALSACQDAPRNHNERYQATAEMRTFQVTVPMPRVTADGSSGTIAMPRGFLEDYQRRGRTNMRITPNGALVGPARAATEVMQAWLSDRGIRAVVLGHPAGTAPAEALTLSYEAHVAVVPECGDWAGHTGFNPSNENHPNFGCAVNRNIGLMVSDPGELLRGRPPGPVDTARQDMVIETYRAGDPLGSPLPLNESDSLTGIGE